jgi:biopolymer transport protein TolR
MRKGRVVDVVGELNLVPYMDIVVNLILFLMLSSTGLVQLGVLNVSAPKLGDPTPVTDPPLSLTVTILPSGFVVSGASGEPAIPKKGDAYDYAALTAKMVEVKRAFRNETKVTITGEPEIAYAVVVGVMDATRQSGGEALFPDVMLMPGLAR